MKLRIFSIFLICFASSLVAVICKTVSDDDTHINWIKDSKKNLLHDESPVEHVRHLSTSAKMLSKQNEDILKYLQQLHDSKDFQEQNKYNHTRNDGIMKEKQVEPKESSFKYLQSRKRTNVSNSKEERSTQKIIGNDSFIQMAKKSNSNNNDITASGNNNNKSSFKHRVPQETCKPGSTDCTKGHVEENVFQYVDLLSELENEHKEEETQDDSEQSANEDDYDEAHHSMYIYNGDKSKPDMYKKYKPKKGKGNMKIQQIESLEYLGAGYDFLFGNPIGDPVLNVDPGYRDSIIKLTYPKFDDDYPEAYKSKSPNGTFVRNEISCNRFEQSQQISTMNQYKKEITSETTVDVGIFGFSLFSASVGYKSASDIMQKKKYKLFMLKNLCFQYVASLSNYGQWQFTDQFNRSISMLPSHFNSLEYDKTTCTAPELKLYPDTDKCGPSVKKWMTFFKTFGTHVSTLVHLGGKITQLIKMTKTEVESSKSESVSASVSAGFGTTVKTDNDVSTEEKTKQSSSSSHKETIVIGGTTIYEPSDPKDFEKWAKSVRKYPMPIKGEYEPLSKILPTRLLDAYTDALEFYVGLHGHVIRGRSSAPIDATKTDLRKMLRDSITLFNKDGVGQISATCPNDQYIVAGFTFSFPQSFASIDNFSMAECPVDETTCTSETNDIDVYNYLFMMCSQEPIPFMEQEVTSETTEEVTLHCDNKNQIILWGFFIVYHMDREKKEYIKIVNCKYGKNQCTFSDEELANESLRMRITGWIVCAHEDYLNSTHSTKVSNALPEVKKNSKSKKSQLCPPDVLFEIAFSISEKQFEETENSCMHVTNTCLENVFWCPASNKGLSKLYIMVY